MRAWLGFADLRDDANARPWLYRILRTVLSDAREKSGRRQQLVFITRLEDAHDELLGGERDALFAEVVARLDSRGGARARSRQIPEDFATAVELHDIDGFKYHEIAEIVGVPIGTVMSRIARGPEAARRRDRSPSAGAPRPRQTPATLAARRAARGGAAMSDDAELATRSRGNPADEAARETRHAGAARAARRLRRSRAARRDHRADRRAPRRLRASAGASSSVHDAVRGRLAAEPPAAASPALRARIAAALDAAPAAAGRRAARPRRAPGAQRGVVLARRRGLGRRGRAGRRARARRRRGVAASARRARAIAAPRAARRRCSTAIVADYRARAPQAICPGRARDLSAVRAAVSFPIEPLRAPEPAAARRVDDRRARRAGGGARLPAATTASSCSTSSPRTRFFRHPAVRAAVADRPSARRRPTARGRSSRGPDAATGTVLVGDVPSDAGCTTIWQHGEARADPAFHRRAHRRLRARAARRCRAPGASPRPRPSRAQPPARPDAQPRRAYARLAVARLARRAPGARRGGDRAAAAAARRRSRRARVRTRSRLQLELTGRILTNVFVTIGRVNNVDVPLVALAPSRGARGRRVRRHGAAVAPRRACVTVDRACSAARSSATSRSTSSAACRTAPATAGSFPSRACARRARGCAGRAPRSWSAWRCRSSRSSIP